MIQQESSRRIHPEDDRLGFISDGQVWIEIISTYYLESGLQADYQLFGFPVHWNIDIDLSEAI